ncbi:MAG: hypothetical protein AAFZ18_03125 [Myxococcota bacterium]
MNLLTSNRRTPLFRPGGVQDLAPLHQPFRSGTFDGLPPPDLVIELQQLLVAVLAPLLQSMLRGGADGFDLAPYGGAALGPRPDQGGYGGVDGFFQDIERGLAAGPPASAPPDASRPYEAGPNPARPDLPIGERLDPQLDYRDLSLEERREISGMSDRERAILHLWGIQMTSEGEQDGGVLLNVAEDPGQFQAAEVELARELRARDEALYGGVTGKSLDEAFFGLYEDMTGEDISARYGQAPIRFAEGPIDMSRRLTGENGLNAFENQVLQLWGHAPLFNGGQIDGNIVDYALESDHALEANLDRRDLETLRAADLASDGVVNGDALEGAFLDTLDRLYLGGPGASAERTMADALHEAAQRRDGLAPPGSSRGDEVERVSERRPTSGGGHCPFLAGGVR